MRHGGLFLLIIATAVALTFTWLHNLWRNQHVFTERLDTSQVDYYLSDFTLYATDAQGQVQFNLKGDHFVHQRKTRTSEIYKPAIMVHGKNDTLSIVATKADQDTAGNIELEGSVTIDKPESPDYAGFELKTADMIYSPHERMVNTDADIYLTTTDGAIVQGTGLNYNIDLQETKVKSNVHAEYSPQ